MGITDYLKAFLSNAGMTGTTGTTVTCRICGASHAICSAPKLGLQEDCEGEHIVLWTCAACGGTHGHLLVELTGVEIWAMYAQGVCTQDHVREAVMYRASQRQAELALEKAYKLGLCDGASALERLHAGPPDLSEISISDLATDPDLEIVIDQKTGTALVVRAKDVSDG
jgi:hypothetical protein